MANYDDTATVSGSIAYFSDGADEVPCKSVKVALPASLTGYNSASVENSGKNLLNYADITTSYRVTSITENGSGSFTVVASGLGAYIDHVIKVKAGQAYSIKCTSATNDEGNASQIGVVNVYDGSDDTATLLLNGASISTRKGFTPTGNYILVRNKVTGGSGAGTGTIVEPQLELGSTSSSYVPYIAPTTYSANLGQTVHGAEVDLVSGTGKNTGAIHTITSENVNEISRLDGHRWYIHNRYIHCITPSTDDADSVVCDKLKSQTGGSVYDNRCFINANGAIRINTTSEYATNSDFLEDFGGSITFAFILDPSYYTDITFDGQEIPTRKGYNAFWSEQGNTELTYYKSGYGFTSVTVHKETPDGEPVVQTVKFHRIVYEGEVDVVRGTGKVSIGESGTEYDPPETFTFEPISISTDEGENTLFANEGASAITYRKAVD